MSADVCRVSHVIPIFLNGDASGLQPSVIVVLWFVKKPGVLPCIALRPIMSSQNFARDVLLVFQRLLMKIFW